MKSLALIPLVLACSVGCAHTVRIESTPGAEILVDGKSIGTAPATFTETTGSSGSTQITARLHGREKTVTVQRSETDLAPIGAGAGVGAGACLALGVVTVVTTFVFLPCAIASGLAQWGALAAGPVASWVFYSHKLPDVVKVELGEPPPAVAVAEAQPY